jgi:outer membrane receptor protein involved in Fe transport
VFLVTKRYKPSGLIIFVFGTILAVAQAGGALAASAPVSPIEEIEVSARLTKGTAMDGALSAERFDRDRIAHAPQLQLDEVLRQVPGFSLFRRAPASVANPTGQGVSLRGLGPNGAGRTLVLLDGVPQNDPFGGWVAFSRLPAASIEQVVAIPGGGAGIWGNAAIAGTLRLASRRDNGIRATVNTGRFGASEGLFHGGLDRGGQYLSLDLNRFRRGDFYLVPDYQRGAVDTRAYAEGQTAQATVAQMIGPANLTLKLGTFSENRGNGTAQSVNATRATDASLRLFLPHIGAVEAVEAVFYGQRTVFSNIFTSVDASRRTETPALNQFSVPAKAIGGGLSGDWRWTDDFGAVIGMDGRQVEGATNELFQFQSGAFQRLRRAGGTQRFTGQFIEPYWRPATNLSINFGLRLDQWSSFDGTRIETPLGSTVPVRADLYRGREGQVANGRIGFNWTPDSALALRGAAYTGFRVPTLNELYRPFRVGGDIVEANPDLRVERLIGAELGMDWRITDLSVLSVTLYQARIAGAVDNVLLTTRPGTYVPLGVVVPVGGTLAQRLNLDVVTSQGLEARLRVPLGPNADVEGFYLYNSPQVDSATISTALVGKVLAQTSRHQGGIGISLRLDSGTTARLDARAQSAGFEDGLNSRRLRGYANVDAKIEQKINSALSAFLSVQNISDARIEAGLRADGLYSLGAPRQWTIGVEARY